MKTFLASVAMAAALAAPAFADGHASGDTVVATVNGTEITLGHLIALRQMLPPEYQTLPDQVLFDGMLEQLIQQQVLADEADDAINRRVELGLENERRAFLAAMYMDQVALEELSEEDVQARYDASFGALDAPPEFNAAHILVETEEEAQDLITQLREGADFAELAAEFSIGPSGPNGGALGWFTEGMMVPEFEAAVVALQPGEVSPPVQTQFGWHVVLLNETREQSVPSLEEVREDLEQELRVERANARLEELVGAAEIERAEIDDLDVALINNTDLIGEE